MRQLIRDIKNPKRRYLAILHEGILFVIGGLIYNLIEMIWRARTDMSMFVVGGLCFVLVGLLNELYPWEMPLCSQMFLSMVGVTVIEFISGVILNIIFKLGVWDYHNMPYNLCGQICLIFSVAWFFLSMLAIFLDDFFRCIMFEEENPHYTWFITMPPKNNIDE